MNKIFAVIAAMAAVVAASKIEILSAAATGTAVFFAVAAVCVTIEDK